MFIICTAQFFQNVTMFSFISHFFSLFEIIVFFLNPGFDYSKEQNQLTKISKKYMNFKPTFLRGSVAKISKQILIFKTMKGCCGNTISYTI